MKYCDYGCGNKAELQLKNGKWCCNEKWQRCPEIKKTAIEKQKNSIKNYTLLKNLYFLCDYGCGQLAKYKLNNGKYCCHKSYTSCSEQRKKNSESLKDHKITEETKKKIAKALKGKNIQKKQD